MPFSAQTPPADSPSHLQPNRACAHRLSRRTLLKGVGGLAAASVIGGGAVVAGSAPAQAALTVAEHEDHGRMQYYKLATSSIGWLPRVNVLLPDGYDASHRYPVLFLLHGGGENYSTFDTKYDIRNHTAGRDLIVVMPDGGAAGWYCDPESSNVGPRNWETFHIKELLPWVDATFATTGQASRRAISGFSMGGFGALKYAAKYPELFASVSSHSGPADLRIQDGAVVHWANFTASATDLKGGTIYGIPWDQARVSADNPVEHVESYRGKRVFLVSGRHRKRSLRERRPAQPAELREGARRRRHRLRALRGHRRPRRALGPHPAGHRLPAQPLRQGRVRAEPRRGCRPGDHRTFVRAVIDEPGRASRPADIL